MVLPIECRELFGRGGSAAGHACYSASLERDPRSALHNIIEGFGYVLRTGPIRGLILLLGLVSLMGMPYAVLMPVFGCHDVLHGEARELGFLMGATGVGALGVHD